MFNNKTIQTADVKLMSDGKIYFRKREVNIPPQLTALLRGKGPNQSIYVKIEQISYINENTDN